MSLHPTDELVVPVRDATALRAEVGARVRGARRRRRIRRMTLPTAFAAVLALVLVSRIPVAETSLQTPASEGRPDEPVEAPAGSGGPSGTVPVVPRDTPVTVPTGGTPSSIPNPLARPSSPPRDNATEVFRSEDVRLAVVRMYEVWELGPDGAPMRKLVSRAAGNATSPAWSPDGRRLAYASSYWTATRNTSSIRVLDLETMQTRVVAESSDTSYGSPSFSPDGTLLAFDRSTDETNVPPKLDFAVLVVDLDGPPGNDRWEIRDGFRPTWAPDGRILFHCEALLCISDVRGANRVPVPNSDKAYSASVSPDGGWIVFSTSESDVLELMRIDGSDRRTLVDKVGFYNAKWSPDGSRIFYTTNYGLRTIRRDGTDLRIVTEGDPESWFDVVRR